MRIAHLGVSALPVLYPLGGAIQRRMVELAKAQVARGHEVIIYSADQRAGRVNLDGVEVRSVACKLSMPLRDIEYMKKALGELQAEFPDVLHFHSLPEGASLFKSVPAKKFLSFDNFYFRRGKKTPLFWWYRRALQNFDCLLPVSEYCLHEFRGYWSSNGMPVRVLHNGVNLAQFYPDVASGIVERKALGILETEKVILYVGRVCLQKGSDTLIQAYRRLRERIPHARLVVAGPGDKFGRQAEPGLVQQIRQARGLYLGAVEEAKLPAVYNMADVFVMPTRTLEMFGMAALEAQACGKPVVCSDNGGLPEVVLPESGLSFPAGDAEALAECLSRLVEDRELWQAKAVAARNNALRFGWDKIAARLDSIYSRVPPVMLAS
jgi:glycosyltransferase involved in cell wall biosynthesis